MQSVCRFGDVRYGRLGGLRYKRIGLRRGFMRECLGDVVDNAVERVLKCRRKNRANGQRVANLNCE